MDAQVEQVWVKPEDIGREACAMEVIASLNQEWEAGGIKACGQKVHAKTYRMLLAGHDDSLVEVAEKCVTLGKLKRTSGTMSNIINSIIQSDSRPGTRARRYLQNDSTRLDKLAASTAAFLACSYLLGIGDGHGDNLMLTEDGELFRIDFGFLFGAGPLGPDAPAVWLPWTVQEALGPRMHEVIEAAREAVRTVLCRPGVLKASVFAAAFAGHPSPEAYVAGLSLEDFNQKVSSLGTFGLFKSAKDLFHDVAYCGIPRWPQRPEINTKSPAALAFLMSRSDADICTPESLVRRR
ncbi:unnamed protein product [Durusdinium trenchii]|uniref:Uncharacterized protein n=2 Tax=Durusdinium trenchii TaxID=1381693 RepID=A0ABP0HFU0_9DINO